MRILVGLLAAFAAVPLMAQQRLTPVEPPPDLLANYGARLRIVLGEAYSPDVKLRAVVRPSFHVEFAVGLRGRSGGYEIFALRPSRRVWGYEAIDLMKSGRMGSLRVEGLLDDPPMGAPEPGKAGKPKRARPGPKPDKAGADRLEDMIDVVGEPPDDPTFRDTTGEEIARLQRDLPENPADLPVARCSVPVDGATAAALIRAWERMLAETGPDPRGPGLDGTDYAFAMEAEGRTLEGETWSPRPKGRPGRLAALAATMRSQCEAPDPVLHARIGALARRLGGRR